MNVLNKLGMSLTGIIASIIMASSPAVAQDSARLPNGRYPGIMDDGTVATYVVKTDPETSKQYCFLLYGDVIVKDPGCDNSVFSAEIGGVHSTRAELETVGLATDYDLDLTQGQGFIKPTLER